MASQLSIGITVIVNCILQYSIYSTNLEIPCFLLRTSGLPNANRLAASALLFFYNFFTDTDSFLSVPFPSIDHVLV